MYLTLEEGKMKNMVDFLKDKSIGYYLNLIASIIALVTAIVFLITDGSDRTFSIFTFLLLILGFGSHVLNSFFDFKFSPMIPAVLFASAFGVHLFYGLPTLSDVWNDVNFVGGNPKAVTTYGALLFIVMILSVVSSFMNQRKLVK